MAQKLIIDVSSHDGKLDWEKLKPEIAGAIIRCGYGSDYTHQDDKWYAYNVEECTRLGIPFGVYLYSYAKTDEMIESEINHVLRLIKGTSPQLPVFIDLEEQGTETFAKHNAQEFIDAIENAGHKAGVYANLNWWRNYLKDVKTDYKWIAQYNSKLTYEHDDWYMWQFTDTHNFSTGKHDASKVNPLHYKVHEEELIKINIRIELLELRQKLDDIIARL